MNRLLIVVWSLGMLAVACEEVPPTSSRSEPEERTTSEAQVQAAVSEDSTEGIRYQGTGSIGTYDIEWTLFLSAEKVVGSYQYVQQDESLQLSGRISGEDCLLTESDPSGKTTGHWRLHRFPSPQWSGSWKRQNHPTGDSLFVTLEAQEAVLLYSSQTWPKGELRMTTKEVSLHSPDSMCRVVHSLWRADGRHTSALAFNDATPAPSFQNRSVGLTDCIDAREEVEASEHEYPPSGEESSVSLGIPFQGILPIHTDYFEYYAGAAHGNYGQFTKHLRLSDFTEITLETLFSEGYREVLEREIRLALKKQFGPDSPAIQFESLPDRFHYELQPAQMVVYFNPYEIGPYVLGQIRIPIPYVSLRHVIHPNGPLGRT